MQPAAGRHKRDGPAQELGRSRISWCGARQEPQLEVAGSAFPILFV